MERKSTRLRKKACATPPLELFRCYRSFVTGQAAGTNSYDLNRYDRDMSFFSFFILFLKHR